MNKIKIVFFATPDIALESFNFFINSPDYTVSALVTQIAKAQNRGKKIVERNITKIAHEHSIPVFEPDRISKCPEIITKLKEIKADFFVTFAFGQILSQEVIDIPKFATINLHASLLPEYRGANPIVEAIMDGKTKTGITTMKTVLELDAGDICLQEEIEIPHDMNVVELTNEISKRSPSLLDKTLKGLYKGELKTIPQDNSKATFTKKITKQDKIINWAQTAEFIHNKIRSMYQINTNHTTYENKIIKIIKTKISEKEGNPGEIIDITKNSIIVGCKKNSIEILKVKPEGKGEMDAASWINGARIKKGAYFK